MMGFLQSTYTLPPPIDDKGKADSRDEAYQFTAESIGPAHDAKRVAGLPPKIPLPSSPPLAPRLMAVVALVLPPKFDLHGPCHSRALPLLSPMLVFAAVARCHCARALVVLLWHGARLSGGGGGERRRRRRRVVDVWLRRERRPAVACLLGEGAGDAQLT
jgi:hypothetical protein